MFCYFVHSLKYVHVQGYLGLPSFFFFFRSLDFFGTFSYWIKVLESGWHVTSTLDAWPREFASHKS